MWGHSSELQQSEMMAYEERKGFLELGDLLLGERIGLASGVSR